MISEPLRYVAVRASVGLPDVVHLPLPRRWTRSDSDARSIASVDDHKSPDECGRIYFAIVSEEKRFIVAHIGLHL